MTGTARKRLMEHLISHGLTRSDLARRTGTTPGAISRILSGQRTPSLATGAAIERATDGAIRVADWVDPPGVRR